MPSSVPHSVAAELKVQAKFAATVCITTIARLGVLTTDTAFLGQLGEAELAAGGFAISVFGVIQAGISGFGIAVNGLCSQASGAGNHRLVGVWLNYAFALISGASVILIPFCMLVTGPIVGLLGAIPKVQHLAALFSWIHSFRLWPISLFQSYRIFLLTQHIFKPSLVVSFVVLGLNAIFNYLLIFGVGLGFPGSPMASDLSSLAQIALLLVWGWRAGYHEKTWVNPFDRSQYTSTRTKRFLEMASGVAASELFSMLLMTVISFLTGRLLPLTQAVHSAMSSIWTLMASVYVGSVIAAQVQVGKALGLGDPVAASLSFRVGMGCTLGFCTALGFGLWMGCDTVASIFLAQKNPSLPIFRKEFCEISPWASVSFVAVAASRSLTQVLESTSELAKTAGSITMATSALTMLYSVWIVRFSGFEGTGDSAGRDPESGIQTLVQLWIAVGLFGLSRTICDAWVLWNNPWPELCKRTVERMKHVAESKRAHVAKEEEDGPEGEAETAGDAKVDQGLESPRSLEIEHLLPHPSHVS